MWSVTSVEEMIIQQAATILLVRDRTDGGGVEVYMQKRPDTMRFLAGHYVFPGGSMDDEDGEGALLNRCAPIREGINPERLSHAYWVTALRETFEEAGLMLAREKTGGWADMTGYPQERDRLLRGELSFREIVTGAGLILATDRMRYFGHRLTPRHVSRKRFATRYFVTVLPRGAEPIPHAGEVAADGWYSPEFALAEHAAGRMRMVPPTVDCLRVIARFRTAEELWSSTETVGNPTPEELA